MLRLKEYAKAVAVASEVLLVHPENLKACETVCTAFVEDFSLDIPIDKVGDAVRTLSSAQPVNRYTLIAQARWHLLQGRILEAKQLLEVLSKSIANHQVVKLLLCTAYEQLCQWGKVENLCRSTLNEQSDEGDWCKLRLIKSLLEQGQEHQLKEASHLLDSVSDAPAFGVLKAMYLLRTGQLEACSAVLDSLEKQEPIDATYQLQLLKAEYYKTIGRLEEASQLLDLVCNNHATKADVLLSAAKIMWAIPEQRPKAVTLMLNVIKLNREIAEPYVYLGSFYSDQRQNPSNLQRAVRCLEKAFQLDPQDVKTSQQLLELYVASHDIPNALKLLDLVIQSNPKDCRWAWIKKGHLHLKAFRKEKRVAEMEKEASKAVVCLQNALRFDSEDSIAWEALGKRLFKYINYVIWVMLIV